MTKQEDEQIYRGNLVAVAVWDWLQQQKGIELVPWCSDNEKLLRQGERQNVLEELEQVILDKSHNG